MEDLTFSVKESGQSQPLEDRTVSLCSTSSKSKTLLLRSEDLENDKQNGSNKQLEKANTWNQNFIWTEKAGSLGEDVEPDGDGDGDGELPRIERFSKITIGKKNWLEGLKLKQVDNPSIGFLDLSQRSKSLGPKREWEEYVIREEEEPEESKDSIFDLHTHIDVD